MHFETNTAQRVSSNEAIYNYREKCQLRKLPLLGKMSQLGKIRVVDVGILPTTNVHVSQVMYCLDLCSEVVGFLLEE